VVDCFAEEILVAKRKLNPDFDVALSFAGEDRAYVEEVANVLRAMGLRVFYDKYERVSLWGKDLYTHLREIYFNRARYTVLFISKHYKRKLWSNHERESAQARAFTENKEYILPVRFDNTKIPGILPTTGYLDLKDLPASDLAHLISKRLARFKGPTSFRTIPIDCSIMSAFLREQGKSEVKCMRLRVSCLNL